MPDITQSTGTQVELQSDGVFLSILEKAPYGVVLIDADGKYLYVNPEFTNITGYAPGEVRTGREWFRKTFPERGYRHKAIRAWVEHINLSFGSTRLETVFSIVCKSGEMKEIEFRSVSLGGGRSISMLSDITERRKAEEKICLYQQNLRSMASQLSLAEERERERLATELHDGVSQTLVMAKIKLASLLGASISSDLGAKVNEIQCLLDQAMQCTRSLTFQLSPPILHELGLGAALEWLIEQFKKESASGIRYRFKDDGKPKFLASDVRGFLFRATRELLVNVIKHAGAHTTNVSIRRKGNTVQIAVQDDGVGLDVYEVETKTDGFGLFSIRERLTHFGGHMEIKSRSGHGTTVTLVVSLEHKGQPTDEGRREH